MLTTGNFICNIVGIGNFNLNVRVEKNCLEWTKKYFDQHLKAILVEEEGWKIEIMKGTKVDGDSHLNQRKGKVFTIYDLVLSIPFQGIPIIYWSHKSIF